MTEELLIPTEFEHFRKVLEMGAVKYGANTWLKGQFFDVHKNHRSMSHHLLESYREDRFDPESGLDPLLHLATRALMEYTLRTRGLIDTATGKVDEARLELSSRGFGKATIDVMMRLDKEKLIGGPNNIARERFKHSHDWGFDVRREDK